MPTFKIMVQNEKKIGNLQSGNEVKTLEFFIK